jgi:hypothetical protein
MTLMNRGVVPVPQPLLDPTLVHIDRRYGCVSFWDARKNYRSLSRVASLKGASP